MPKQLWKPGQSGNPSGRPKTRIFTEAVRKSFVQRAASGSGTNADLAVRRLWRIVARGKDSDSLAAIRLLAEYNEGKPTQHIDVSKFGEDEAKAAAYAVAAEMGEDPDYVFKRAQEIAQQHGIRLDGETRRPGRVMPVPYER